jgi:hypothetical protein
VAGVAAIGVGWGADSVTAGAESDELDSAELLAVTTTGVMLLVVAGRVGTIRSIRPG